MRSTSLPLASDPIKHFVIVIFGYRYHQNFTDDRRLPYIQHQCAVMGVRKFRQFFHCEMRNSECVTGWALNSYRRVIPFGRTWRLTERTNAGCVPCHRHVGIGQKMRLRFCQILKPRQYYSPLKTSTLYPVRCPVDVLGALESV